MKRLHVLPVRVRGAAADLLHGELDSGLDPELAALYPESTEELQVDLQADLDVIVTIAVDVHGMEESVGVGVQEGEE